MKKRVSSLFSVAGLLTIIFGVGCAEIPPRYYVATSTQKRTPRPPATDEIKKIVPDAGNALNRGRATIAFIPPRWCLAVTSDDGPLAEYRKKHCILLTAALEKRAADDGYSVVDWRKFQDDPYGAVKRNAVDVLFILEEVELHLIPDADVKTTDLSFGEQVSRNQRAHMRPDNETLVTARCTSKLNAYRRSQMTPKERFTGLTLSLKMVSGNDGLTTWYYRHSMSDSGAPKQWTNELYYLSEGEKETKTGRLIGGSILTAIGVASLTTGLHLNRTGDSFSKRNSGAVLSWVSAVPLGIGVPFAIYGLVKAVLPPVYEEADKVLCTDSPIEKNPFEPEPASAAASVDRSSSRHDARTATPPTAPQENAEEDYPFIKAAADHFLGAVGALQMDRVEAPPAVVIDETHSHATPSPATDDGARTVVIIDTEEVQDAPEGMGEKGGSHE